MLRSKPRNTRSYKGRPESNLPGNDKAENHLNKKTEAVAPPLAGVKGKSDQAPGQQKKPEQAQNGKGHNQTKTNGHAGTAGLNGIAHRSDRANEVAQNTHKNPHLVALGLGEGTDGGTSGGDTSEASNPGQCDTLNAGCTAGEAEEALYTGDEIVIIGDTKEQQFYYHPDHLGSTAYITDSRGQLTEHLEYFPFGETWVQEGGSKKTPYLYTGKELDQETGLYYYGARYYDPRVSIWASPDPILEKYLDGKPNDGVFAPLNLGLYTYAHQSPIIYNDPDGNSVGLAVKGIQLIAKGGDVYSTLSGIVDNARIIADPNAGLGDKLMAAADIALEVGTGVNTRDIKTAANAVDNVRAGSRSGGEVANRAVSEIDDKTKPGSKLPNIKTDVPKSEFEKNLVDNGFSKSTSKDGNVNIFTSGDKKYSTRDFSNSTNGPTAEVFKNNQPVSKIRLGDE